MILFWSTKILGNTKTAFLSLKSSFWEGVQEYKEQVLAMHVFESQEICWYIINLSKHISHFIKPWSTEFLKIQKNWLFLNLEISLQGFYRVNRAESKSWILKYPEVPHQNELRFETYSSRDDLSCTLWLLEGYRE